jgi:hypothetical protein
VQAWRSGALERIREPLAHPRRLARDPDTPSVCTATARTPARTDEVLMSNVLRLPAPAEAVRSRFADPARADAPLLERLRFSPTAGASRSVE